MYCPNCGNKNLDNAKFCNNCGTEIKVETPNNKKNNIKMIIFGSLGGILLFGVVFLLTIIIGKNIENNYYFNNGENTHNSVNSISNNKSKYKTSIITDNVYLNMNIININDAVNLIKEDSNKQKDNCPKDIKKLEEEISSLYDITAVNLCELDYNYAKELGSVYKRIYNDFPYAKGYLTNLSLTNNAPGNSVIALFMPVFQFASSNTSTTYPWVIKTQVHLSSTFFLNLDRLELAVKRSSDTGHFPKNSNTYSPIAHELGHYISFLALMRHYNLDSIIMVDQTNFDKLLNVYKDFDNGNYSYTLINEAYNNYKNDTFDNISIDDFRSSISLYAMAKDNDGNYIYDETIAEAFHDVYLNNDKAKPASKYIYNVLKSKLN